jgi:hypothetical protein
MPMAVVTPPALLQACSGVSIESSAMHQNPRTDMMCAVVDEVQTRNQSGKAVMNMSLGGVFSQAINDAIEALRAAGVVPVVAAGNANVRIPLGAMP